jgi:hypothetical protein
MAIARNQAKAPVLPKEAVDVPEIGGEVIVRGLLLTERLALFVDHLPAKAGSAPPAAAEGAQPIATEAAPAEATLVDAAADPQRFIHIPRLLALCVLASDQLPLWSVQQWEEFGAQHFEASLRLFHVAQRLSGLDIEVAKKN